LHHFSSRFLFLEGDWSNPRQSTPYTGYLYLPELATLLVGMYVLVKTNSQATKLLLAWLILAPIPSALSRDIISAVRSLPLVVPLTIISGLGLSMFKLKKVLFYPLCIALVFFCAYFFDLYFVHSPHFTSSGWLYPYKPAMALLKENKDSYSNFVISTKLGQPYIFVLFHLRIDPGFYQSHRTYVPSPVGDVGQVTSFGSFEFRPIFWPADRSRSSTLFIGDDFELPESDLLATPQLERIGDIATPDQAPLWKVVALP
jgi:hypothetical protein